MLFTSKTRSCVHTSAHRRRITKSDATVDGEYDPDLALAIQESLKQAEIDALKAKEKNSDALSKLEFDVVKENRPRKLPGSALTKEIIETKHLKELVCVHLDLIQQQQDVISQKDKTIKTLKADNNALQCRLQRMERRMVLLKQKEEMAASPHIVSSPPPKPGTMSYTEPIISPFEKQFPRKKIEVSSVVVREEAADLSKQSPLKTASAGFDEVKNKSRESHRKRKLACVHVTGSSNKALETSNLYYVAYYEPLADEVDIDSRPDILKGAQAQIEVEVPSYRLKTYTNLYVIEGTEDHEDETFIRRHQKPEIEEKRRKRWDDQRVREEKMLEKLREKQELRHKDRKPEDPVESFYPCLDDITHIEVLDSIPVTAFGQPMPFTKQESFTLPWCPRQVGTASRLRHK